MPALSKLVTDRVKSANNVGAAIETHTPIIVTKVDEVFGAGVGQKAADVLHAAAARLSKSSGDLEAADTAHTAELGDDAAGRDERDRMAEAVRGQLVTIRGVLTGVFGEAFVASLGFSGRTPDDPVAVERLGRYVVKALDSAQPPAASVPGFTYDQAAWQQHLAGPLDQLTAALSAVAAEERQAETTLVKKQEAIAAFDAAFSATADLAATLLKLAGEKELADRVRPSPRRSGLSADVAGDVAPPPPADAPVTE